MTTKYNLAERRVEDLTRMLEAKPGTPMPPIIDEKEIEDRIDKAVNEALKEQQAKMEAVYNEKLNTL